MKDKAVPKPTWKPFSEAANGHLSKADKVMLLPDTAFAFPRARKEPMDGGRVGGDPYQLFLSTRPGDKTDQSTGPGEY